MKKKRGRQRLDSRGDTNRVINVLSRMRISGNENTVSGDYKKRIEMVEIKFRNIGKQMYNKITQQDFQNVYQQNGEAYPMFQEYL